MRVPRSVLTAYNNAIKREGGNAKKAAIKALQAWLAENPGADVAATREFCKVLVRELSATYGSLAGDAAYALRNAVAEASGVSVSAYGYTYEPDTESIDRAVRYQAKKLVEGDQDGFSESIGDMTQFFSERGANDTMFAITEHDARKLGRRAKFARVPTGPTTCPWCLMLASRGFVYVSADAAGKGNKFHRDCDCRIVPGYGDGASVEGYDPADLYKQWKDTGFAPKSGGGKSISVQRRSQADASVMTDDEAHKLAQKLLRGTTNMSRDEVVETIASADIEWRRRSHSPEEDNYFAGRVNRLMVEHAITPSELMQIANLLLKR